MPDRGKCEGCNQEILWAKTEAGKWMPLDPEPALDGNIVLDGGTARVLTGDLFEPPPEGPRYKSHFATCPRARDFRGRGKK